MGILGFGSKKDPLFGLDPKKVQEEMERLRLHGERVTVDLRRINRLIEARMNEAASPSVTEIEAKGKAIEISQIRDEKSLKEHELAKTRKAYKVVATHHKILQSANRFEGKVLDQIKKLGPEKTRAIVEQRALADKQEDEIYNDIINTGQIFTESASFELDADSASVWAEIKKLRTENPDSTK